MQKATLAVSSYFEIGNSSDLDAWVNPKTPSHLATRLAHRQDTAGPFRESPCLSFEYVTVAPGAFQIERIVIYPVNQ
jgi:hypothetical protein